MNITHVWEIVSQPSDSQVSEVHKGTFQLLIFNGLAKTVVMVLPRDIFFLFYLQLFCFTKQFKDLNFFGEHRTISTFFNLPPVRVMGEGQFFIFSGL